MGIVKAVKRMKGPQQLVLFGVAGLAAYLGYGYYQKWKLSRSGTAAATASASKQ